MNWRLVLATVIGFLGSACGTVGGVGGGGIFVPMLTLIVGFDTKSAAAISKCNFSFLNVFFLFYLPAFDGIVTFKQIRKEKNPNTFCYIKKRQRTLSVFNDSPNHLDSL